MRHKKAPPYNKQFLLFKLSTTRGAYQCQRRASYLKSKLHEGYDSYLAF